jgi:DNA (cytosine-5)-methyltransferase 1
VADLFAGIGGFHLAFAQAGAEVVFASENDRHARATYEANFQHHSPKLFASGNFAGDIRAVTSNQIPPFDVLTAGFPCQPFSEAGNRRGFADTRGTLFFEIARILDDRRPRAFFLENVRGITHRDHRHVFETIQSVFTEDLGYSFHWKVIRACDFGLPQLRPRAFMVGFRDPDTPFAFPDPVPLRFTLSDLLGGRTERDVAYTVLASHGGPRFGHPRWDAYLVDGVEHRLTLDEIRRLQGFPDDFVFPVTPAQAMKQLGNAVAVPAVRATAERLLEALGQPADSAPNWGARDRTLACKPLMPHNSGGSPALPSRPPEPVDPPRPT